MEFHTRGLGSFAARSSMAADAMQIQFCDQSRALGAGFQVSLLGGVTTLFDLRQTLLQLNAIHYRSPQASAESV